MKSTQYYPVLMTDRVAETARFYEAHFRFARQFDSDWYVQLHSPGLAAFELGIISRTSELVPPPFQTSPAGMYLTFVVPDVDAVHHMAQEMKLPILQAPRNEFYGQRRLLITDPSGCLLDISSPWDAAP